LRPLGRLPPRRHLLLAFRPALLARRFGVRAALLHSAFQLFELLDDIAGQLIDVRHGVAAGDQTEIELVQIADQGDVQRQGDDAPRSRFDRN
jgi:hypothetical protein